jgi:hypothetical protein
VNPARLLSFSPDAFVALFETYNRAVWPAQFAAYALGIAALALVFRPGKNASRSIAAILAAFWAWTGIAYHGLYFAEINFLAPAFAVLFVLQAALFAWASVRGTFIVRFRPDPAGWAGVGLAAFALLGYPLLGWLFDHGWPRAAVFGITPCPTTIFTFGLLLLAEGRPPWLLYAIPILWAVIGGSAAGLLGMLEDASLPLAAALAAGLALGRSRWT